MKERPNDCLFHAIYLARSCILSHIQLYYMQTSGAIGVPQTLVEGDDNECNQVEDRW